MCRRNKFIGSVFCSLGLGILLGTILRSTFWCLLTAGVFAAVGVMIMRQR